MNSIPQEILVEIDELLKKLCVTNKKFADIIIDEISTPLVRSVSFRRETEGLLIVRFITSLSHLRDNSTADVKCDYECELKISNSGFQYEKTSIIRENSYKYTLMCKKNLELTHFSKENFHEYKSTISDDIPYSEIDANNEIDIFNSSQQLSHEENKVNITCFPSHKGKLYVKKILDIYGLIMNITNPLALELLSRLGYNTLSVEKNRSEHSQILPILENSVVQLIKKESINFDNNWDAYYNEQNMFVGDNKYESHKNLNAGAMYYNYGVEECTIAKKYFEGSISIEEVLNAGEQIFLNYEKNSKYGCK